MRRNLATGDILEDGTWESHEDFFWAQTDSLAWLYDGFELFGNPSLVIAAPKGLPPDCIQKLKGAVFAYTLGNSSVDYTIRNYLTGRPRQKNKSHLTDIFSEKILSISKKAVEQSLKIESELKGLPDQVGLVAAGAALVRLESSFSSSALLIRLGHNFEAATIMKLILEQLGWALRVHKIYDDSLFQISPSKCISDLSKLLPATGSFYGVLNEEAHIKPRMVNRFIRFTKKGKGVVMIRDRTYSPLSSFMHLCLADALCIVLEIVYKDYIPKLQQIRLAPSGLISPRSNRPLAAKIRQAKVKLIAAYPETAISNHLSRISP